ncbi:uncharacterized protein TrAtP1_006190 [Trichoderma atroviride]|uniref:uncharacterized protein n=1 Tax=Hypocrea atroviridis TaxID=63577 RepID=UPI00332D1C73|nr:hypothetical protein TrAtP1_006190 [Trichoderma atroviride]
MLPITRPPLAALRSKMETYPCTTFLSREAKFPWLAAFALLELAYLRSTPVSAEYGVYDLGNSYAIPGLNAYVGGSQYRLSLMTLRESSLDRKIALNNLANSRDNDIISTSLGASLLYDLTSLIIVPNA